MAIRSQHVTAAIVIGLFVLVYLVASALWSVPVWVAGAYLVLSICCCILYGRDKLAARSGNRRIPERTLLLVGLAGGWPGGLVGQQMFRHKTQKRSFRVQFWLTVIVNTAGFVVLTSPVVWG
jgi:uncharacterized membrane protein YsdA (DUF1294 family)